MALIDPVEVRVPQVPVSQSTEPTERETASPSLLETLGAAGRLDSEIIGGFSRQDISEKVDMDFDVFEEIKGTAYESNPELFVDVHSRDAYSATVANLEQERKDRLILQQSGWVGVGASMGASLISPTTLIPGGVLVKSAGAGFKVGKTALAVGASAAAATTIQEGILQRQQAERTALESSSAIIGSMVIGSILGGTLAGVATRAQSRAIADKYAKELAGDDVTGQQLVRDAINELRADTQGVGAAQTPKMSFDDLAIADGTGGAAAIVAKMSSSGLWTDGLMPALQTMQSPSVATRRVLNDLIDQPAYTKANFEGQTQGPSVENAAKYWQRGALASWIKRRDELYKTARKSGYKGRRSEFNEEVGRAARRNDEHPIKEIAEAAAELRSRVFEPLLKRSTMPDDVKTVTAPSYFHRVWNTRKMLAEETRVKAVFDRYFRGAIKEAEAEAVAKGDEVTRFANDADFEDYVSELVRVTYNNITGLSRDGEVPDWIVPLERGPLKGRTFKIADEVVEDFLESDAEIIARRYTRVMGAEVELTEKFGRADMKDQFKEIDLDYEKLRGEVKADKKLTDKQKSKKLDELKTSQNRDITNLEAWRDMIRGTYRIDDQLSDWGKITRTALSWNYLRLLGGVVLSSAADLARIASVHGMKAMMNEGIKPLVTNLKAVKLSVAEAREMGAVVETVLNSRLASLAELQDPYAIGSPFERMLSNATTGFSKATGLLHWNDGLKAISSTLSQNRIIRNAMVGDYQKLNKYERGYMAFLGIDETTADDIAKAFKQYGSKEGEVYVPNTHKWPENLRLKYASALNKDVDRTIVTKGAGDTPLFMQSNAGKLVMQFKSFALASHSRVLMLGLQERPTRFAGFMAGATAIGMMVSWLKMVERNDWDRANSLVDNPGRWIADGLDRTGIFSVPFEVLNTADKMSAAFGGPAFGTGAIGGALAGDEDRSGGSTRYQSRNAAGALLGPTIGLLQDWGAIGAALGNADINKGAANAFIRQVPGATLPGARSLIHYYAKPALMEATGN